MRKKKPQIILEKIEVTGYAAEGKSLAKMDGKVIFVEGAVPGDVVDLRLGKNKKDWAEGTAIRFHQLSTLRVKPFCSHFGVCGGCQWQMLSYEKQLEYKEQQVKDSLQRIGKVELPDFLPILGAAETKYYRNKIEYTFSNREYTKETPPRKKETLEGPAEIFIPPKPVTVAGYHARGFFDKVVDIKTCYLQGEPTNALRNAIKELAIIHEYSFYDIREHHGFLRTMQVRLCTTGQLMVNIVFGEDDEEKREALLGFVQHQFPEITTLLYTINTKWNDSLHDLQPVVFFGNGYVTEELQAATGERFRFKIGPKSFFQTNTRQAEKLYRVTNEFAGLSGKETVYDLYCGTGSIGIFLSRQAKKVVGVEMIAAAIDDAKENAVLNDISHASFFAGDVIDVCNDEFIVAQGRPDVVITDPPRAGMHEKLVKKILDMEAPTVVYVSCNPATQARDLNLLDEKYGVTRIQPVDMFPHTLHIENVVQLKLKN